MKKLVLILVVFLFSACSSNSTSVYKDVSKGVSAEPNDNLGAGTYVKLDFKDEDARDEVMCRLGYIRELTNNTKKLAEFLFYTGGLSEFMTVNSEEDQSKVIGEAVALFANDEEIHQRALERAKVIYSNVHIDSNWRAIRKCYGFTTYDEYKEFMAKRYPVTPPLVVVDSDEPVGFWLPPEDFLSEEEKEFRERVIETAGLDKNSPDFEEQLTKLYTATSSTEFPNYETYKLFIDRLATIDRER